MTNRRAIENVTQAKSELAEAESQLDNLIKEIEALPRAQKVTVSTAVTSAFDKLKSAHARLAELEALLREE